MPRQPTAPRFLRLPEVLNLVGVTVLFHPLSLDGGRDPPQADLSGLQHRRLGGVCYHLLDGRADGIQMTRQWGA